MSRSSPSSLSSLISLILSTFIISIISRISRSHSPSSFEAALSLLLRSDARAVLRCFILFRFGLLWIAIWDFLAAGLANAIVRVPVFGMSCVHAGPPKCKGPSRIACDPCLLELSRRLMAVRFSISMSQKCKTPATNIPISDNSKLPNVYE